MKIHAFLILFEARQFFCTGRYITISFCSDFGLFESKIIDFGSVLSENCDLCLSGITEDAAHRLTVLSKPDPKDRFSNEVTRLPGRVHL